ncbi:RNA-guided endonuclease InsQ/TnpB family protein [Aphanothece sacrum]|uniref:Transposase, IS605 OrfB family protein n=1 Tax=Aphanothece sacrum FPU1 TaxID=1920663 RepID=A0A401IN31_APHSA|nr:RNA-guided endonuclease TnpB family protein [Aphanothece sacrum]GBF82652.1 transposase, IS605 OrfB family protein [Aphanothece sacrum FPU1]GBF86167.1 transposase, IS605 OrfB family [Aphanothece sacrum FPU3]
MLVFEFKVRAKKHQYLAIDEAIKTAQFVQNKCLRYWIDNKEVGRYDLNKYCRVLAHDFKFANELNSQARQSSAERAWSAISRFYEQSRLSEARNNCKKKIPGKKGYPRFKNNCHSVEYKTTGWNLDPLTRKAITFTDKKGIGRLRLVGTYDLHFYKIEAIKRVRLVKRADGYYCQFILSVDLKIETQPTGKAIGLDVGLESFYTDHEGNKVENPRFLSKGEKKLKKLQRKVSKKKKGSSNRRKARQKLGRRHLKISRQRKEYAKRIAYCVVQSRDLIAYEDLRIKNLVKNHCLAKSISDAAWYQFRLWLEYFGTKYGKHTIAVPPQYTSQNCSNCGRTVKKSLSTRTHICSCGCTLDRDENAARNILRIGLSTAGHTGTWLHDSQNAWGEDASTLVGGNTCHAQATSVNQESPPFYGEGVSNELF